MLCAMVNDLRVHARLARIHVGRILAATRGNGLPRFTEGQVVAGSNPVSPTDVSPTEKIGPELLRSMLQGCILRPCGARLVTGLGTTLPY
jgi:hypothetical protein